MNEEKKFRIGACHAAQWLRDETRKMTNEGHPPKHISAVLGDMVQVLLDWREGRVEMPAGNPWEWPKPALADYIATRKSEW
jgi:hypothetical protein